MDNIEATLGFRTYRGFAWDLNMCLKAIEKSCRSHFPQNSRKLGSLSSPAMAAATNRPVCLQIRDYCCMMSCCRAYGYCSRHAECSYVLYYNKTPYVTNGDLSTLQISEIARRQHVCRLLYTSKEASCGRYCSGSLCKSSRDIYADSCFKPRQAGIVSPNQKISTASPNYRSKSPKHLMV